MDNNPPASHNSLPDLRRASTQHQSKYDELLKRWRMSLGSNGHEVLERLYRNNLVLARLALFTDHVRIANIDMSNRPITDEYPKIQPDLSRYSNAVDDYKRIMEYSAADFAAHVKAMQLEFDVDLLDIARSTVALEECQKELGVENLEFENLTEPPNMRDAAKYGQLVDPKEKEMVRDEMIINLTRLSNDNIEFHERLTIGRRISGERVKEIKKEQERLLRKISAAIFDGLALIVPMLIMVLHPKLITVITTTSVFVLVVSVVLAAVMKDAEPKDVVAATAAYAAVLVVFVGGSGGGSTSNGSGNSSSMSNSKVDWIVAVSIVGTLLLMMALFAVWLFIAFLVPGIPVPILGVENPRTDKKGEPALSIYKQVRAGAQPRIASRV